MALKIAVIGGGSSYTPELAQGLFERAGSLGLAEVALHDIDTGRLETVAGFVRRMARAQGSPVTISSGTDLARAVQGASFIVAQIRVGGNQARLKDELLGERHGLIGQETTGVGGMAKALRTIPAMLEAARIIKRETDNAFLINFTNPSGIVTEALLNRSDVRAVGLCNIPISFKIEAAAALGAAPGEVELDYVGLNHLSWVRSIKVRGEEAIGRALAPGPAAGRPANLEELDYPPGFLKALGMVPMHYLRYYYLTETMLQKQSENKKRRAEEVMEIEAELMRIYADESADEKPAMLSRRGGANYSLAALDLIEGLHHGRGDIQVVDVKNNGALAELPGDAVIECPCRIGREGAEPLPLAPLEPEIAGLVAAVKAYERLTVKAAAEKSKEAALMALVAHPLGPGADRAEELLNDMIEVHGLDLGR